MVEIKRGLKIFDEVLKNLNGYEDKSNAKREYSSLQKKHNMSNSDVSTISQLIMLGFEYDDEYIIPEYQRNLVWTKKQKSELINSILYGNPIGDFLFKKEYGKGKDGEKYDTLNVKWTIIDGQQRIEAIRGFFMNKFSLPDGKYFKDLKFWDARDFMENYKINCWAVQNITFEEEIEIYLNRNCGGTKHTKKEIEKAKDFLTK